MNIISFLFGGWLGSLLGSIAVSALFYFIGIKRDFKKLSSVFNNIKLKMESSGIQESILTLNKDTYTKEELLKICQDLMSKVIARRDTQLNQFIKDVLKDYQPK